MPSHAGHLITTIVLQTLPTPVHDAAEVLRTEQMKPRAVQFCSRHLALSVSTRGEDINLRFVGFQTVPYGKRNNPVGRIETYALTLFRAPHVVTLAKRMRRILYRYSFHCRCSMFNPDGYSTISRIEHKLTKIDDKESNDSALSIPA